MLGREGMARNSPIQLKGPSMHSGDADFRQMLLERGVIRSPDATLTPLAGGVSSDIYRVDDGDRVFVVKRALPKLKVEADWHADVRRNAPGCVNAKT